MVSVTIEHSSGCEDHGESTNIKKGLEDVWRHIHREEFPKKSLFFPTELNRNLPSPKLLGIFHAVARRHLQCVCMAPRRRLARREPEDCMSAWRTAHLSGPLPRGGPGGGGLIAQSQCVQTMLLSGDAEMGTGHFGHFDQTRRSCSQHHGLAIHVIFGPVFFLIFPLDIFKICFRINAILSLKNAICL